MTILEGQSETVFQSSNISFCVLGVKWLAYCWL